MNPSNAEEWDKTLQYLLNKSKTGSRGLIVRSARYDMVMLGEAMFSFLLCINGGTASIDPAVTFSPSVQDIVSGVASVGCLLREGEAYL
jgi:hypothetical protein